MFPSKRVAVAISGAVAVLALSACSSLSATAAAQPTPGPSGSGAASEAFGSECPDASSLESMSSQSVTDAVASNPDLSLLVGAALDAGLVDSLNNAQNITVFAPTNDAFAKVAKEDLEAILANQETLRQILTYHVVPETLTPDNLAGTHATLEGSDLSVTGSGTDFVVNETATVVCGNIKTANATLYIVDGVIMPS